MKLVCFNWISTHVHTVYSGKISEGSIFEARPVLRFNFDGLHDHTHNTMMPYFMDLDPSQISHYNIHCIYTTCACIHMACMACSLYSTQVHVHVQCMCTFSPNFPAVAMVCSSTVDLVGNRKA